MSSRTVLEAFVEQSYKRIDEHKLEGLTNRPVPIKSDKNGKYIIVKDTRVYIEGLQIPPQVTDSREWRQILHPDCKDFLMSADGDIRKKGFTKLYKIRQKCEGGQRILKINRVPRDVDRLFELTYPELCDNSWIDDLELDYDFIDRDKIMTLAPVVRQCLLIYRAPELLDEIDFVKNKDIDLNTFPACHEQKIWWLCDRPVNKHSYECLPEHRVIRGDGCYECYIESCRTHSKEDIESHIAHFDGEAGRERLRKADASEDWMVELIGARFETERIGHIGNPKLDILVKINREIHRRGLQIKTITQVAGTGRYNARCIQAFSTHYPSGTLLATVDDTRKRYQLDFTDDLKFSHVTYTHFLTQTEFLDKLELLLPSTLIVDDITKYMSPLYVDEYRSIKRLKALCEKLGLSFRYNTTNSDTVDCFINDYPVQCKFSKWNKNGMLTYRIHTNKNTGRFQGRAVYQPYEITDPFKFLIAEVGGTKDEPDKYKGNFCIMSKEFLIAHKRLKSDSCPGQKAMCICPPDYQAEHMVKDCWNDWSRISTSSASIYTSSASVSTSVSTSSASVSTSSASVSTYSKLKIGK
jgi:hypothetical protein